MAVVKDSRFFAAARADARVVNFLRAVNNGAYSLDGVALMDEIERQHMTRLVRRLDPADVLRRSQILLNEANLKDQASRSRLVEIQLQCNRKSWMLHIRAEAAERYIKIRFQSLLQSEFRTAVERQEAIKSVLAPVQDVNNQIEQVLALVNLVVADIDQAGYAITRNIKILELSSRPERNV